MKTQSGIMDFIPKMQKTRSRENQRQKRQIYSNVKSS